ncbi:MAG: hypothetical protein ACI4W2_07445 [Eubacterium sp.]
MTLLERDQRNIEKGRHEQIIDTISQALKRGKSVAEIADVFGMTEKEVRDFCKENEIPLGSD